MISELRINNYKSLHDVTLDVGRFNVLIGENGCGKSNLLEAIAFVAAAESNKLEKGELEARGIRVPESELMRSAFDNEHLKEPIKIYITFENSDILEKYTLQNENSPYSKWNREGTEQFLSNLGEVWGELNNEKMAHNEEFDKLKNRMLKIAIDINKDEKFLNKIGGILPKKKIIKNFVIYSPENTALRNLNKEGQIEPLGINGEGLFKLLNVIQNNSDKQWTEIHNCLQLFDWYSECHIQKYEPKGLLSFMEERITITDRYLTMDFDQHSANEGFLFVLFYIALMVSDDTPKIFAIDNIDTSLNPKLCTKIIKELVRLAKKYDKQVFVTTHNPAILDGIDLGDDEQRLFVVSRNKTGHTRFKRITLQDKPVSSARAKISRIFSKDEQLPTSTKEHVLNLFDNSEEPLKLSEAFLRGYLGGLPTGF